MKDQLIVGIDVSSATLDICVISGKEQETFVIKNETRAISKFFKAYKDPLLIGMENTGRYNWSLYEALKGSAHRVFVLSPLHLKRSMGLVRGKNDKVDAIRIAVFIKKNHADLPQWRPSPPAIQKLKVLLTERNSRIKTRGQLLKQQHDLDKMKSIGLDRSLRKLNEQQVAFLDKQIAYIENMIKEQIEQDE